MKVDKVNTATGNELIANFAGYIKTKHGFTKDGSYMDANGHTHITSETHKNMPFHESWPLLMKIILMLEDKGVRVDIFYRNCKITWSDEDNDYEVDSGIQGESKIDAVWTAICYFLSWVNDSHIDLDNPVNYD